MKIQILGTGCPKCQRLYQHAELAAKELNLSYEMIKIQDIDQITDFGVMMTPALAIDDEVKSAGKLLSVEEIKKLLSN